MFERKTKCPYCKVSFVYKRLVKWKWVYTNICPHCYTYTETKILKRL